MKIPKYIADKMYRVVALEQQKHKAMNAIENWLEQHNIDPEELRDGCGIGLDELDYGNEVVELLVRRIQGEDIC